MAVGFIFFRLIILVGPAVPASARALHHEDVSRGHFRLVEGAELGPLARTSIPPRTQHIVAPGLARLATRHAVRPHEAMSRENRRGHRLEEAHPAHRAVAAAPASAAAGAV